MTYFLVEQIISIFGAAYFLKRVAMKSRGSSTRTANAEVSLFRVTNVKVIDHV